MIGVALIIVSLWTTRNMQIELLPKATMAERWASFKEAFWGLMMPAIILGGIYGGRYVHHGYGKFVRVHLDTCTP